MEGLGIGMGWGLYTGDWNVMSIGVMELLFSIDCFEVAAANDCSHSTL